MTIETDIQKLEPGAIVELFELDLTPFGGDLLRFHAGTNALLANVTWNANVYTRFPVAASGFEFTGQGQAPRPKLMASNIAGAITALVLQYEDLVGAKVTRRRTLAKYLDAVNFPARRNLLLSTGDFSAAAWTPVSAAVIKTSGQFDPFGATSAWILDDQSLLSDSAGIEQGINISPSATTEYVVSIYVKQGNRADFDFYTFFTNSSTKGSYVRFNLSTKTWSASPADGGGVVPYNVSLVADQNGFYRASFTVKDANSGLNTALSFRVYPGRRDAGSVGYHTFAYPQLEFSNLSSYQPVLTTWSQNPTADPSAEFPADIFYIDRKSVETSEIVEFELAPAMDITGVMLPRRQIIQNICPWRYRGSECGYTGTSYFDVTDVSVGSAGLDVCGKRLTSCKLRFGQYAELPFGGFPVAGLFR